ncbi:MAG: hypothetical protein HFH97_03020 [Lachnospiraceae bacterium]|nr:hypothetical protein [uncultured Acetatifactor sp.]MCI9571571.1 hypothetical protein [Lachnospiraceae bacterium]
MSDTIYVYGDFCSETPALMGYLYIDISRGVEHVSFEFDRTWLLDHKSNFILDPDLYPVQGRQYPTGKSTFGLFADASPDRWGNTMPRFHPLL